MGTVYCCSLYFNLDRIHDVSCYFIPGMFIGGPKMSGNFVRERQRIVYIYNIHVYYICKQYAAAGAANFFSVDSRTPPRWSDSSFSCAQKHTVQRLPKCAGFMCAESARILLFTEYGGEGEYCTNFGSFEPR